MDAFRHILSLLAFVFAVSLTHLLSRIGTMVVARERVVFSFLAALAILNSALLVYSNWLSLWEVRNATGWDLLSISVIFVFALSIYYICTLAAPHAASEGPIDMEQFYWHQRVAFYSGWLFCEAIACGTNILLARKGGMTGLLHENLVNFGMFPPILLALLVNRRWAQWTGSLLLLLANLVFMLAFETKLG